MTNTFSSTKEKIRLMKILNESPRLEILLELEESSRTPSEIRRKLNLSDRMLFIT
jgi:DNA-binding transcriptional ArsR family regulator